MQESSSQKRLQNRIPAFAFALFFYLLFLAVALMLPAAPLSTYLMADIPKRKLLSSVASPRIIFLGGSNVAFGINSSLISELLKRNVVNCGIHIGLGLNYMLSEAQPMIKEDDIVVIMPEYEQFYGIRSGSAELLELVGLSAAARATVFSHPELWNPITTVQGVVRENALRYLSRARIWLGSLHHHKSVPTESIVYTLGSFNSDGDIPLSIGTAHSEKQLPAPRVSTQPNLDRGSIDLMNDFAFDLSRRGAQTVYIAPAISREKYYSYKREIDNCRSQLSSSLKFPVLGNLEDSILPGDCFFDSPYHLTSSQRIIHSKYISQLLLPLIRKAR